MDNGRNNSGIQDNCGNDVIQTVAQAIRDGFERDNGVSGSECAVINTFKKTASVQPVPNDGQGNKDMRAGNLGEQDNGLRVLAAPQSGQKESPMSILDTIKSNKEKEAPPVANPEDYPFILDALTKAGVTPKTSEKYLSLVKLADSKKLNPSLSLANQLYQANIGFALDLMSKISEQLNMADDPETITKLSTALIKLQQNMLKIAAGIVNVNEKMGYGAKPPASPLASLNLFLTTKQVQNQE
jgi:hypothetical protein